jgi:iron complex transport system substrate-binding protein
MRIISLLPSSTDAVVALGAGDQLVGVSHSCDGAPPGVPVVTACAIDDDAPSAQIDAAVREIAQESRALYSLDAAVIRRLRPDIIFTQGLCEVCAVSEGEVHRLAATIEPQPRVVSLSGGTIDGVLEDITAIGRAIDCAGEAEELVDGLRLRMRRVHDTLKAARAPRPRAVVLEWTDPLFAGGHWVPEQVRRAGGVDVIAEPGSHSHVVSAADVERAAPDVILVAPCGFGLERAQAEAVDLVARYPWTARSDVWALDANGLTSRPGPRVVDGIETMARIFAPSLFTPYTTGARQVRPTVPQRSA